jgi:hypothetical protein
MDTMCIVTEDTETSIQNFYKDITTLRGDSQP